MSHSCQNIVRSHDYDRYLLSLFAPSGRRAALWALFAFNYEIAKTREVVSDTTIGLIRLQWWRDALNEIYEGKAARKHEVVDPLAEAIKAYQLPREDFDSLIYAREFDLEGLAPANAKGLLNYCDFTTTPLMRLAMKIMGLEEAEDVLKALSVHYAVIGTLRAVPYMLNQRRMMLPQDILTKNDLSEQKIFDFKEIENLPQVIKQVLECVQPYRNKPKSRFLKAMAKMSALYERQIKSVDFNVFDPSMATPPKFLALRLWFASTS